ncbi:MAG: hypothetical protein K5871_06460 [Lachnospiraceae bacterium]|nr:hypothetical protein [Lachnospiraceae bacterium]
MSIFVILLIIAVATSQPSIGSYSGGSIIPRNAASNYEMDPSSSLVLSGDWRCSKLTDHGRTYLLVRSIMHHDELASRVSFWVYDSAEEAGEAYEELLEQYRDFDDDVEVGDNYFYGDEPDVCDAAIVDIHVLDGNVIMQADLEVTALDVAGGENGVSVSDRSYMMDYILENTEYLEEHLYTLLYEGAELD